MGSQTTTQHWKQQLIRELEPLSIIMVDEQFRGARSLLMYPRGSFAYYHAVCQPPRPVDDVAILLIERYLERLVT